MKHLCPSTAGIYGTVMKTGYFPMDFTWSSRSLPCSLTPFPSLPLPLCPSLPRSRGIGFPSREMEDRETAPRHNLKKGSGDKHISRLGSHSGLVCQRHPPHARGPAILPWQWAICEPMARTEGSLKEPPLMGYIGPMRVSLANGLNTMQKHGQILRCPPSCVLAIAS